MADCKVSVDIRKQAHIVLEVEIGEIGAHNLSYRITSLTWRKNSLRVIGVTLPMFPLLMRER